MLLRPHQIPLYEADKGARSHSITVQVCSRRYGKTFEKLVLAVETAIQNPDCVVRFAFPAKEQGKSVIEPNIRRILASCPPDKELLPVVKLDNGGFVEFANKSRIYLAGTDDKDQRERLRGMEAILIIVDEGGSHKELEYVVDDILSPQVDTGGGKLILVSTPPKSMDHAFVGYWTTARRNGTLVVRTIKQNTFYSRETLLNICAKANKHIAHDQNLVELVLDGKIEGSPTWEREYMCRMVTDKRLRVCPDFVSTTDTELETVHVKAFEPPKHCTRYVFIDQGHATDYFAAVFASHVFGPGGGTLYVEDAWQDRRKPTDHIVEELKKVERRLGWVGARRFSNDPRGDQQRADMRARGYHVVRAAKSEGAEAEADRLNLAVRAQKVVIHPRCSELIAQMRDGIWKETATGKADFERGETLGHLDALAALAMGIRCVDWRLNMHPPETFDFDNWIVPKGMLRPMSETQAAMRSAFGSVFKKN